MTPFRIWLRSTLVRFHSHLNSMKKLKERWKLKENEIERNVGRAGYLDSSTGWTGHRPFLILILVLVFVLGCLSSQKPLPSFSRHSLATHFKHPTCLANKHNFDFHQTQHILHLSGKLGAWNPDTHKCRKQKKKKKFKKKIADGTSNAQQRCWLGKRAKWATNTGVKTKENRDSKCVLPAKQKWKR